LPELLAWSSSFSDDLSFAREDVLGSAAHATMLGKTGIIPKADAIELREKLLSIDVAALPKNEEDIHMAVESHLGKPGARLHTARSRNDQVALDLRLHVRDRARALVLRSAEVVREWTERGAKETETVLAAYTHRQRAQPISFGFQIAAWCAGLLRATESIAVAMDRANELALGSGACSGSSLPIDRSVTARLLGFPKITVNALDTVGDRDFALDWTYACARLVLALGKPASDLVDLAAQGLITMTGAIATGSSMMPQKKNPDIFELVRAKAAGAVSEVFELLVLVKGLPSGYNRDQQDDRRAILSAGPRATAALEAMALSLPNVAIEREKALAQVSDGSTQATDLAEALVKKGVPFREAYKAVGAAVKKGISTVKPADVHPACDAECLAVLDPVKAMKAKTSQGGTAPERVREQLAALAKSADDLRARALAVPDLDRIAETIRAEPL
jgi:argininosuccinate lyase